VIIITVHSRGFFKNNSCIYAAKHVSNLLLQLKKAFPPTVDAAHLAGQRGEKAFLSAVPPLFAAFESRLMDNRLSGLITSEPS
jgi:hypothetical protein